MTTRRPIIITGGGTGGHVFEATAIAGALVDAGRTADDVILIGSSRGQEATLLSGSPYPHHLLPGRGIRRSLAPPAILANVAALIGLGVATLRAFILTVRLRPAAVVSVGGYASVPASVAAVVCRRPLVLVTIDAVPGLALRLLGRFAVASAVAFAGTELPRATVTGTPVRPEVRGLDRGSEARASARRVLGLDPTDDTSVVGIFGGSLGARTLNVGAVGLGERWSASPGKVVYHVTGRRNWDAPGDEVRRDGYVGVPFCDRMDALYAASELVVCRSGAVTVAEVASVGVPSILVPLPGSPGDHQTANARALAYAGAAILVPDVDCTPELLGDLIEMLLADRTRLEAMANAARALSHDDAATRVGALIAEAAR